MNGLHFREYCRVKGNVEQLVTRATAFPPLKRQVKHLLQRRSGSAHRGSAEGVLGVRSREKVRQTSFELS